MTVFWGKMRENGLNKTALAAFVLTISFASKLNDNVIPNIPNDIKPLVLYLAIRA